MEATNPPGQDWREWRRLRALALSQIGWQQHDIAVALDVSEGAVSRWLAAARNGGAEALCAHPAPGRPPKLTADQLRLVPDLLWHGPEVYGFRGEIWNCKRVAGMLWQEFDVSYSISQVSRLLKGLDWTPQVPITRAIQRDEAQIERWRRNTWPHLKKTAQNAGLELVFVDESGFYLLPALVKTYAPHGQTPVLSEWQTHDHLSVMGAVTLHGKIYSMARLEPLNGKHTIVFLEHLLRMIGNRLLIIWDGSQIHRRAEVKVFIMEQTGARIQIERLPPYAPDLNPVEWLWQHLKDVELANLICYDLDQLHQEFHLAIERARQTNGLVEAFFEGAKLDR